ncbi:hypothetical protein HG536_0F03500 [Torulaspora globosa]|uniref:BZIP domain-containing protein n=1 Tax=Torulaspora globosa TaxID=48254 RepID=A0A7G3ZKI9_9SACH|nr:uncharacterized protein HG536_0F03500 [Torulaspora globosa]QLL34025.1 hypothetical protein HG536_0F03500 [Torulaspora globosa]
MSIDREQDVAKYAELKPKSSADAQLAMSKVYTSRSWNLPPRSKPGRRPTFRNGTVSQTSTDQQSRAEGSEEESYDLEERKKRQNRDAQRAYRERRANRLLELEGVVETLQNLVKTWQRKYKAVESELNESKRRVAVVEEENASLQKKLGEILASAQSTNLVRHEEADTMLLDPLLQGMIHNFKPMKAVALKKRKLSENARINARDSSDVPGGLDLTPASASSVDCGFCSGDTACVCEELANGNSESNVSNRCTEDTATCTKCSNIEESCIKPQAFKEAIVQTAVSRKRCISAPQSTGMPALFDKATVSLQTSVSLGSAESLAADGGHYPNSRRTACGCKEKSPAGTKYVPMIAKDSDLKLLGLDHGEQPNTMDPNFVPGSCTKCQRDPQRKAFCQAIFGPPTEQNCDGKKSSCCGEGSCSKADQ